MYFLNVRQDDFRVRYNKKKIISLSKFCFEDISCADEAYLMTKFLMNKEKNCKNLNSLFLYLNAHQIAAILVYVN